MGIKHRADSASREFLAFSKLSLGGQINSSEMPTFHTRDRCGALMKTKIKS